MAVITVECTAVCVGSGKFYNYIMQGLFYQISLAFFYFMDTLQNKGGVFFIHMDNNQIKQYLNQAKFLKSDIISKQNTIAETSKLIDKSVNLIGDGCVIDMRNSDIIEFIQAGNRFKGELSRKTSKLIDIQNDIQRRIDRVDDSIYRSILQMYYLNGLTFDQIAEKMCYSRRHITRLYQKAIEKMGKL